MGRGREARGPNWAAIDADPDVRRLYQREIDAYNADKPHHEQIRAFALLPQDLTIEDGSITPTLKVKRRILENRYQALIEGDVPGGRKVACRVRSSSSTASGRRTPAPAPC